MSSRTAATTDSTQKGSAASARAVENNKWQLLFGLILLAAVMLSVIVLITASLSGREADDSSGDNNIDMVSPPPSTAPTPTPTPTPTPSPSETPTSVAIYFLTDPVENGFTTIVGESVQLNASVYPLNISSTVEWRSTDESVFTVDQTGKVTGVGAGTATLIASCGGIQDECQVIVKESW
ncbi:MAG: Ig-like domain-containing protein [Oscillospiraceae bacterium]